MTDWVVQKPISILGINIIDMLRVGLEEVYNLQNKFIKTLGFILDFGAVVLKSH